MTQETERNQVPFKNQLHTNLDLVVREKVVKKVYLSMQPWLAGLMVFGGADPDTGYFAETSTFEFGFLRAHCKNAWENIGDAPSKMAFLSYPKVRQQLGDTNDHTNDLMHDLHDANDLAVFKLHQHGFDGSMLRTRIEKVPETAPITVKNSQSWVKALEKEKTRGAKFTATGVGHVKSNETFKATEMGVRENDIKAMEGDKKDRKKLMDVKDKVMEVLARVGCEYDQLKLTELIDILRWHQIPPDEIDGKDSNYDKWQDICGVDPRPT